jgi:hypothetical protein
MSVTKCFLFGALLACGMTATLLAQSQRMRANITAAAGEGRCTYEVVVDGTSEVEIFGDQGTVRTQSGSPASWRRLECHQPLPNNPSNFRFQGLGGRGSQQLVRDPNESGGIAIIRIDDPKGGNEVYTGTLLWRDGTNYWGGVGNWGGNTGSDNNGGYAGNTAGNRGRSISPNQAMNICRDQTAATLNVASNRVRVQIGVPSAGGSFTVNFSLSNLNRRNINGSCSVSRNGRILQFQVDQGRQADRVSWNQALNRCQEEVARRLGLAVVNVRVQHGADPGNGSYFINFQAQKNNGRISVGSCRISPMGEIVALQNR